MFGKVNTSNKLFFRIKTDKKNVTYDKTVTKKHVKTFIRDQQSKTTCYKHLTEAIYIKCVYDQYYLICTVCRLWTKNLKEALNEVVGIAILSRKVLCSFLIFIIFCEEFY